MLVVSLSTSMITMFCEVAFVLQAIPILVVPPWMVWEQVELDKLSTSWVSSNILLMSQLKKQYFNQQSMQKNRAHSSPCVIITKYEEK